MKEQTMMILKMIESGKITADEGVKLINAVSGTGKSSESKSSDVIGQVKKKVTNKVSKIAKEAEPKVKAAASAIAEKSGEIKKKVEGKINEAKMKERAEDIIDDIEDVIDDITED